MLRLAVRLAGLFCGLLVGTYPALATDARALEGTWSGERDGQAVIWHVGGNGRLRVDGRPAAYAISGDTLTVRFDSPAGGGETAVYRFQASDPHAVPPRLFVYGFDLGSHGLFLQRAAEAPLPEDAAPAAPDAPKPPGASR